MVAGSGQPVAAAHDGRCFTCCGEVFVIEGRWEDADEQFRTAITNLEQTGHRSRCAHPVLRLARLRIRQGRLEEADFDQVGMLQQLGAIPTPEAA